MNTIPGRYESIKNIRPEDLSPEEHYDRCLENRELGRLDYLLEKSSNTHIHALLNLLEIKFSGLGDMLKEANIWSLYAPTSIYRSTIQTPLTVEILCKKLAYVYANRSEYLSVYKNPTEVLLSTHCYEPKTQYSSAEHDYLNFLRFINVVTLSEGENRDTITYSLTEFGNTFITTFNGYLAKHTPTNSPESVVIINESKHYFENIKLVFKPKILSDLLSNNNISFRHSFAFNFLFPKRGTKRWWLTLVENIGLVLLIISVLLAIVKHSPILTLSHLFYALIFLIPKIIK
jgi:hypothetical protein